MAADAIWNVSEASSATKPRELINGRIGCGDQGFTRIHRTPLSTTKVSHSPFKSSVRN